MYKRQADVCSALEISKTADVRSRLKADGVVLNDITDRLGRKQSALFISEGNLYRAVFQSRKPKAEEFTDWIAEDVIPTLRETGEYSLKEKKPDSYMIDDKVERAKRWIEEQEDKNREIKIRDDRITELEPKAMICDEMISSNMLMNFRDAAYILGISQSQFTGWLEENGYVYRNADNLLRPTEKYRNSGLFEVKPFRSRSSYYTGAQTHVTAKGLAVFKVILNSDGHTQDTLPKHGGRNGRKKH